MAAHAARVRWMAAFLDEPASTHDEAARFWSGVTGWSLSPPRGEHDEFASLLPDDGDATLKLQRLRAGSARVHLDVHVEDVSALRDEVRQCGGEVVDDLVERHGYVVMRSPGGFVFCLVPDFTGTVPLPRAWPGGRSIVDQVCLDIAPALFDGEAEFWSRLTGWPRKPRVTDEFDRLTPPPGAPLRLLLQRLDAGSGVGAHLDLAADDRDAEVARHVALGATVVRRTDGWTTLRDPTGREYCVTARRPPSAP